MFWQMLCPPGEFAPPAGALAAAIAADFGSLEALQGKLSAAAAGVQGSGWGWLGYSKDLGKLAVATTANQDPLETATGLVPIFGVDVWEVRPRRALCAPPPPAPPLAHLPPPPTPAPPPQHAYYLQYKNARPDYLKAIWQVANWRDAAARFEGAAKG
jgi:Fe-Mn family superoxide dismutase